MYSDAVHGRRARNTHANSASRSMKKTTSQRYNRQDWLHKALDVLASQGPGKLNIENLCRALDVSRGSFYWHFTDRKEFIRALLELWYEEYSASVPAIIEAGGGSGLEKFKRLVLTLLEQDLTRFDLPIRSWAMQEAEIAEIVIRVDHLRLNYISGLFKEMGFTGNELETRARTALAALTMEHQLMDKRGAIDTEERAELLCRILCGEVPPN